MKNKKTILIAARNISGRTGASKIILFQAHFLAESGWTVFLVANKIPVKTDNANIKCFKIPIIGFSKYSKRIWFSRLCSLAVGVIKPNFVYGHGDMMTQDFLALHNCVFLASEVGEERVLPSTNDVGRFHRKMLIGGKYRKLIANSLLMKRDLISRYDVEENRIDVLYPGYSSDEYNPFNKAEAKQNILEKYELPLDSMLIGFVASGDFKKRNLKTLILAFSQAKFRDKVYLVVVGSDKYLNEYKCLVKDLGIESKVVWAGFQEKTYPFMKSFDLFVQPASHEEFGMTVLEAMASGTAVIVSNGVGASELFCGIANENVLKSPVKVEDLALALEKNIYDTEYRQCVASTLEEISQEYSWDKNFEKLLKIIDAK